MESNHQQWLERPYQEREAMDCDMSDEEYEAACERLEYMEGMRDEYNDCIAKERRLSRYDE